MAGAKMTKKQRKWGRNATFCLYYKNSNRREKNKVKKLKKHLLRFPSDLCALKAVDVANKIIRGF